MITLVDGTSGGRALPGGNWPKGVGLEVYSQALLLRNVSSGLYAHIHTHSIQVHTHSIQAHTHKPTWNFRSGQHAWSYFCVFTWAMFWVSSWGKPRSFVLWPSPSRLPWSLFLCCSYHSKTLDINDWSHQEAEWNEQSFQLLWGEQLSGWPPPCPQVPTIMVALFPWRRLESPGIVWSNWDDWPDPVRYFDFQFSLIK